MAVHVSYSSRWIPGFSQLKPGLQPVLPTPARGVYVP
jgi:hypothetical protein